MFDETFDECWQLRYGTDPGEESFPIERFLSHRSIRKYSEIPVPEALVASLIAAAQSAATSSNLQLYSIVSVQDRERRDQIATLCADQRQVRGAAWYFAFCVDHYRLRKAAREVGETAAGLDYAEFYTMGLIDAALAAERMVCAAESLGLGICYIGALRNHPDSIQDLLGLPDGVFGAFGLCLGWPAEESRSKIKPRLDQDAIWFRERYDTNVDTSDFEARMLAFYESQNMPGERSWRKRSGVRADNDHLTGRHILKGWLERLGFNRR